jgi:hypothetical protein
MRNTLRGQKIFIRLFLIVSTKKQALASKHLKQLLLMSKAYYKTGGET